MISSLSLYRLNFLSRGPLLGYFVHWTNIYAFSFNKVFLFNQTMNNSQELSQMFYKNIQGYRGIIMYYVKENLKEVCRKENTQIFGWGLLIVDVLSLSGGLYWVYKRVIFRVYREMNIVGRERSTEYEGKGNI